MSNVLFEFLRYGPYAIKIQVNRREVPVLSCLLPQCG